jgi:hypothetical protein
VKTIQRPVQLIAKAFLVLCLPLALFGAAPAALRAQTPPKCRALDCTKLADGDYWNPKDCSSFIQCSIGQAYVMPCPAGLHFNEPQDKGSLRDGKGSLYTGKAAVTSRLYWQKNT